MIVRFSFVPTQLYSLFPCLVFREHYKTAFLEALNKADSADPTARYDAVHDYPRRHYTSYQKKATTDPATVAALTYRLSDDEIDEINAALGFEVLKEPNVTRVRRYDHTTTIGINVPEGPYLQHVAKQSPLSSENKKKAEAATSLRSLLKLLEEADLNAEEAEFKAALTQRFNSQPTNWDSLLSYHIWKQHVLPRLPKFLYFDDYYLLPGKINLEQLQQRVNQGHLDESDKTVLGLLRIADVNLEDITRAEGYEASRAKLEGISNSITDRLFEYWTQNSELEVIIDIRPDPQDQAPFNSGNNLYIRIRNKRHRVTVPFSQRSKGFIWFFSFIVWFDSVKEQLNSDDQIILLLDEPGLSLHALAQADLLRYIDELAQEHQILYTTHSPFMVQGDRLHQVRTVEDRLGEGTKITENVEGSDPKTIFPLQAALGYTIAQNLFISKRNLLVEGPADLIYMRFFGNCLESDQRTTLRDEITIVPTGGLDNLATFVALLGGNKLGVVVMHDYAGQPHQRLQTLVTEKLIRDKQVHNYAMYRNPAGPSSGQTGLVSTDVEDLITPDSYLEVFSAAYSKELNGAAVPESDLPPGDRIVDRITRYLASKSIVLKKGGGFNHYRVANHLASNPTTLARVDADTLSRFENLFKAVNDLL
jgi:hypothetical protein